MKNSLSSGCLVISVYQHTIIISHFPSKFYGKIIPFFHGLEPKKEREKRIKKDKKEERNDRRKEERNEGERKEGRKEWGKREGPKGKEKHSRFGTKLPLF